MGSRRARQTAHAMPKRLEKCFPPGLASLTALEAQPPCVWQDPSTWSSPPQVNQNPACRLHTSRSWPDLVRPPSWASDVLRPGSMTAGEARTPAPPHPSQRRHRGRACLFRAECQPSPGPHTSLQQILWPLSPLIAPPNYPEPSLLLLCQVRRASQGLLCSAGFPAPEEQEDQPWLTLRTGPRAPCSAPRGMERSCGA